MQWGTSKKNGMSYKKSRRNPAKAKKEKQQIFLDERLTPLLGQAVKREIQLFLVMDYISFMEQNLDIVGVKNDKR